MLDPFDLVASTRCPQTLDYWPNSRIGLTNTQLSDLNEIANVNSSDIHLIKASYWMLYMWCNQCGFRIKRRNKKETVKLKFENIKIEIKINTLNDNTVDIVLEAAPVFNTVDFKI